MLLSILIVVLVICFLLAKLSRSSGVDKFVIINIIALLIYNLIGWGYIFQYLDVGGASLGPGLMLMFFTILHVVVFFIISMIISAKEQTRKEG